MSFRNGRCSRRRSRLAAREVAQYGFQRPLVGADPAFWLAELVQHDKTDPVAVFLVSHPGLLQFLQLELALYRKPESGDELPVLLNHGRGDTSLAEGEVGGGHHPQRDPFALIVGSNPAHELDGVGEGVTVIQVQAVALFPLVSADNIGLDLDASCCRRLNGFWIMGYERSQGGLQM